MVYEGNQLTLGNKNTRTTCNLELHFRLPSYRTSMCTKHTTQKSNANQLRGGWVGVARLSLCQPLITSIPAGLKDTNYLCEYSSSKMTLYELQEVQYSIASSN